MSIKIKLKRGLEKNLPELAVGEPAFTTDTKRMYVGTESGNIDITKEVVDAVGKLEGKFDDLTVSIEKIEEVLDTILNEEDEEEEDEEEDEEKYKARVKTSIIKSIEALFGSDVNIEELAEIFEIIWEKGVVEASAREIYFDDDLTFITNNSDLGYSLSIYTSSSVDELYDLLSNKEEDNSESIKITLNNTDVYDSTSIESVDTHGFSVRYTGNQQSVLGLSTPVYTFATDDFSTPTPFIVVVDLGALGLPLGKSICFVDMNNITHLKIESGYDFSRLAYTAVVPYGVEVVPYDFFNSVTEDGLLEGMFLGVCIPSTVKRIGYGMLGQDTGQTVPLKIPEGVESIGAYAFYSVDFFSPSGDPLPLILPSTINYIGENAFNPDVISETEYILIQSTFPPILEENVFGDEPPIIYVPINSLNEYKSADGWKEYEDKLVGATPKQIKSLKQVLDSDKKPTGIPASDVFIYDSSSEFNNLNVQEALEALRALSLSGILQKYVGAADDDFIVKDASNSYFEYIGTDEYVVIPKTIQGNQVKNLKSENSASMFRSVDNFKGVVTAGELSDFSDAFRQLRGTSLDVRHLNTSQATDMSMMFYYSDLTNLDVSNFDTSKVTNMDYMFDSCYGLTSLDLSNFDTSQVANMGSMFSGCSGLTSLDLSNFDTSKVTRMSDMFNGCKLKSLDVSNFDTSKVIDISGMFRWCSKLESLDLSNFDTSQVTDMNFMFSSCSELESLDVSNFDTSKVTRMAWVFNDCSKLESLDVSNFDTSKATSMSSMFSGCSNLTSLDVSNFDTSQVKYLYMGSMFKGCSKLESLDLSNFDTSQVTEMHAMFSGCSGLTSLDLSSFTHESITKKSDMFLNVKNCTVYFKDQDEIDYFTDGTAWDASNTAVIKGA